MTSQELFEAMKEQFLILEENHEKRGNKAAQGRARKAAGEFKKLVTEYRKASVEEGKK